MIETNYEKIQEICHGQQKEKDNQNAISYAIINPKKSVEAQGGKSYWPTKKNSCVIKKQNKHHCYMYIYHTLTKPNLDTCTEFSHLVSKALTAAPYILSPTDIRIKEKTLQVPSNCIYHYNSSLSNYTRSLRDLLEMTTALPSPLPISKLTQNVV